MSNITQVINTDKNLKILKKAVHGSDMDQLLSSTGPFTLFAPSDLAFEKLEKGLMEELLEPRNRPRLAELVKNHVVSGKIVFKELKDGDELKTVNGRQLNVQIKDGNVTIDSCILQANDQKISNGVIYAIGTVLENK